VSYNSTIGMKTRFYCLCVCVCVCVFGPVWVQTVPVFLPWSPTKYLQTDTKSHTTEDLGPIFILDSTEKKEQTRTHPMHVSFRVSY
jgi:hypothetical protein